MLRNQKGAHHIFLSLIMFFLAVVGSWQMWHWYKEGTVKQNLSLMLADFSETAARVVTDPADRDKMDEKVSEIRNILNKYEDEDLSGP